MAVVISAVTDWEWIGAKRFISALWFILAWQSQIITPYLNSPFPLSRSSALVNLWRSGNRFMVRQSIPDGRRDNLGLCLYNWSNCIHHQVRYRPVPIQHTPFQVPHSFTILPLWIRLAILLTQGLL